MDGDGIGDLCDPDIDGDGVANVQEVIDQTKPYDNCDYLDSSITLVISGAFDCDQDGVRDDIDLDDDNDGILDTEETQDDLDELMAITEKISFVGIQLASPLKELYEKQLAQSKPLPTHSLFQDL